MKTNGMKMFSDKVPGGAGKMSLTDCKKQSVRFVAVRFRNFL